jgi:hypothetical protein
MIAHEMIGKDVVYGRVDLTKGKSIGRMFNITKIPYIYKFITYNHEFKDGKMNLGVSYQTYKGPTNAEAIYK